MEKSPESLLNKGDKCVIDIPEEPLKELQRGHGGWSIRMSEVFIESSSFLMTQNIEISQNDNNIIIFRTFYSA